ncbi:MAG: tRNA (N(6)-L-threonylcarbamoyladenosine(37)-C(2))-methylthiotransferase MtaB [Candidatus Aminicenantales bacterium]
MTRFAIQNFGCRVNQAECFSWAERLERQGLELEKEPARADIVIVNTCTLTNKADRDSRKFIRRIERQNPRARLVVTGCSVEADRAAFEKVPSAWLVLTNREKETLPQKVMAAIAEGPASSYRPFRSRALLKVQDGCNLRCTFCVIPRVRGKSRSVSPAEVVEEAGRLSAQGFREIVLCGIHLSSYGCDRKPASSLLELLQELTALQGLGRIRLSSLDPAYLTVDLIEFLTENRKICPHFHLSLQHGSDAILVRMGRKSKAVDYRRILSLLRQKSPDAALGADIIAGFPGESREDFEASYALLDALPLTYLHVFPYSPRPGTPAASWHQVAEQEKKMRSARLRELGRVKRRAFELNFLGRELDGLVVKKEEREAEILTGNYLNVRVDDCPAELGQAVRVEITSVDSGMVRGRVSL